MRASTSAALSRRRLQNPCGPRSSSRRRNQGHAAKMTMFSGVPKKRNQGAPAKPTTFTEVPKRAHGLPPIGGWYPAVTNANAAGMLSSYVLVLGPNSSTGVLYKSGFPPQAVTITGTQPGGPTGTRVRVTAGAIAAPTVYPPGWPTESIGPFSEALAPFSQGSSVVSTSGRARVGNPDDVVGVRAPCTPGMPCSSNCWWTETGWLCCITGDTPWPKCRAGGIITPGGGGVSGVGAQRLVNPAGSTISQQQLRQASCADDPMLDMAALKLRSQNPALDGVDVLDVEPLDASSEIATEGDVMVVTYVDPTDGREKIAAVMVIDAEDAEPWWKHDGHCCEDCALGSAKPCDGGSCSLPAVTNPAPRYGVFAR